MKIFSLNEQVVNDLGKPELKSYHLFANAEEARDWLEFERQNNPTQRKWTNFLKTKLEERNSCGVVVRVWSIERKHIVEKNYT